MWLVPHSRGELERTLGRLQARDDYRALSAVPSSDTYWVPTGRPGL